MAADPKFVADACASNVMSLSELTLRIQRNETMAADMLAAPEYHTVNLSHNICDDFQMLDAITLRYEAQIIDRWTKKTFTQRKKMLLAAWPGMAKEHRPDREEYAERSWLSPKDATVAEHIVQPFINQEDFIESNTLLVFLHARGRMPPWEFAASKLEFSLKHSWFFGGCEDTTWCTTTQIQFTENMKPNTYDDKYSFCARRGFQMLLMQKRILAFLHTCARQLLSDKSDKVLLDAPIQDPPINIHPVEDESKDYESFTDMLLKAPCQGMKLDELLATSSNELYYPEHEVRTSDTVEAMRTAEQNLDGFCAAIDSRYEGKAGVAQHDAIRSYLENSAEMHRTLPWTEGSENLVVPVKASHEEQQSLPHDKASQITGTFDRIPLIDRVKPKTRGNTDPGFDMADVDKPAR
ncbi:hypothetical protein E8E11_008819 [Didymella keratinophila]|nr:hypothetical protein E8E11_008819 [Didymella keratinophila]